jgi:gas vesicle protein
MEYSAMRTGPTIAIGIGIGAAIGLAAGIFLAPKSGRETIKDIKNKAVSTAGAIKNTVRSKTEAAKNSMSDMADRAGAAVRDVQRDMGGTGKSSPKPQ